jgi:transcriptional regulator with XRE-family HTH domain
VSGDIVGCYTVRVIYVHAPMLDFGFASEQEIRLELGRRLRAQRLAQGLSQVELAQRAGIGVNTLKLLEGRGKCTFENFIRTVLGLGLADELQSLLMLKINSIAQMERAEQAKRMRAPRARRRAADGK